MSAITPASSAKSLFSSLKVGLSSPSAIGQNFAAAAVIAVINVATAVSIGMLVFAGELEPEVSVGIGFFLMGTAISGFLVPALSDCKFFVSGPRGGQAPIFAAMAVSIVAAMPGAPAEELAVTVIAAFLASAAIVGAFLYFVGYVRWGTFIRTIPYPVMGGFFAGLGFLLLEGGTALSLGPLADNFVLSALWSQEALMRLLPTVGFGLLLFAIQTRLKHKMLVPLILVLGIGAFHLILLATGLSIEAATALGWFRSFDQAGSGFFPILTFDDLTMINWWVILQQYETIFVLCMLSVIALLIDVSGVEIITDQDLDPNRELRSAGIANMVGVVGTSPLGIGTSPDTGVAYGLGGNSFLMIVFHTLMILGVIIAGPWPIALIPAPIVGGFLIYLGLKFLIDWVWQKRQSLPLTDIVVIGIILVTVAIYGVLEGVAAGVLLATILFVLRYGKLSVVKAVMTGDEHVSHIDRHVDHQDYLDENGHRVQIFVLQGFLFFGSANRLLQTIKHAIAESNTPESRYLIIDFMHVADMDSSAANSFAKLMQICAREKVTLCVSCDQDRLKRRLHGIVGDLKLAPGVVAFFPNLDEAAGWCDDQLLIPLGAPLHEDEAVTADVLLADLIENENVVHTLSAYFDRLDIAEGDTLFEQGDPGDALYLIHSGSISIVIDVLGGAPSTVRTMRVGAILGEMSVYTGEPRSASAFANKDSVLFRLTNERFNALVAENPAAAEKFSSCIVKLMAERLDRANKAVFALSK